MRRRSGILPSLRLSPPLPCARLLLSYYYCSASRLTDHPVPPLLHAWVGMASHNVHLSEKGFWVYALPLITSSSSLLDVEYGSLCLLLVALICLSVAVALIRWASPGGPAWGSAFRANLRASIPGPRGWPFLGSLLHMNHLAHRSLAHLASLHHALPLMAVSLGSTRVIVASKPSSSKEILTSTCFANRPLKESAKQLLFDRAIGFAPYGDYWRKLRRIATTHLFSLRRIAQHEVHRQAEAQALLDAIAENSKSGQQSLLLRPLLQQAALNNVMITVFGKRYDFGSQCEEARQLQAMVREGFEVLGAFNLADHLPALQVFDTECIRQRCEALVPRVNTFVSKIILEHRQALKETDECSDFVHVLLGMQAAENLEDADIIAILWEMIFRGTDSVAILLEWILAELALNPRVQQKLAEELKAVVGEGRNVRDSDISKLPYLQAVVYETLRLHPPGPLLSWARLAIHDVEIAGYHVPAGTTAMVNMWAITHDPTIWSDPLAFTPERFMGREGGPNIDIRGRDLRLAPFGAGRRVCPGKELGLATVNLWLARLIQRFEFEADPNHGVDLAEVLKLSCEMKTPLVACPLERGRCTQEMGACS